MSEGLRDTQRAFDSVAAEYDGVLGNNDLVQRIRTRTMRAVQEYLSPASCLLDLGCGTGLDAEFLASRGYSVTAMDWSPEMVRKTNQRAERMGLSNKIDVRSLGFHELDQIPMGAYDGAYSDLGALNCDPNLEITAKSIAAILKPGGLLIASVIGRVCPWELALFTLKKQPVRARVRFNKNLTPVPLNGGIIWTRYYTPKEFISIFDAVGFKRIYLRSLGLFVPPPYMQAFADRHPRMVNFFQWLDDRFGAWLILRGWGDHFLVVMQRRD